MTDHRPDDKVPDAFVALADELADLARQLSLPWFRRPVETRFKADASPVTEADRGVERLLRSRLAACVPAHGVLGEEFAAERPDADWVWAIDPIDGTKSFISGIPLWGTLIALMHRRRPVLGLIDAPATGERWSAAAGAGAWYRGPGNGVRQACRASACSQLDQARLCLPSPDQFDPAGAEAVRRLATSVSLNRYGGDCYSYGLLAAGHLDLIVETGLDDHDFLPLVPLIEEAGGVITDWSGNPLGPHSAGDVIAAATKGLHRLAIAAMSGRDVPSRRTANRKP